jgi:hypothetical protein
MYLACSCMDTLALSSLSHLYAIVPFILYGGIYDPLYSLYCLVIVAASIVSASLHTKRASLSTWMTLNVIMTMTWFSMDIYISNSRCDSETAMLILQSNNIVSLLCIFAYGDTRSAVIRNSTLNFVSATKSIFVSYLIVTSAVRT